MKGKSNFIWASLFSAHGTFRTIHPMQKNKVVTLALVLLFLVDFHLIQAQTTNGELEGRAAPVARRKCVGGANAGNLCNSDADCPSSTCVDRNVFNVSVAVQFNATAAELTAIQNLVSAGSATLFDVTDGQAEIGEAFIYNNAFGTGSDADIRIYPTTTPIWWQANTGSWQVGGSIHVSIDNVLAATSAGESLGHEFVHLAFDARDEYEARAAGCGDVTGSASCPAAGSGGTACLMDQGGTGGGDFSELCWGQGNSANLTDFTAGNHDATNVTEHSRCRSNRSCWDQVVWAWPNTFTAPTGAPDPAAGGSAVRATRFVMPNNTTRVVLVLDESGSMSSESPSRMARLKVAAKDFIAMAENNTELGIVSYSDDAETTSGRANVAIATLGANRTAWNNAIDGLTPSGWTNIGAGLQRAIDMINTAGGVTANTFIVLMTDGLNNRPAPQTTADADLQAKVDDLLALGIPVYVTCTGSDLGLASQCSEIATGTGGFYVDSSNPAQLSEAFIDLHERISRRDAIGSYSSWKDEPDTTFLVEQGSESVTFSLIWAEKTGKGNMVMIDPNGNRYQGQGIPQGQFVRVRTPIPGKWRMLVGWSGTVPSHFVKRGYSRNAIHALNASIRHTNTLPGGDIYVYAYPRSFGGSITDTTKRIKCWVRLPDGSVETMNLNDLGRRVNGGDDIESDGIFTGVFKNATQVGYYEFLIRAEVDKWRQSDELEKPDTTIRSATFVREVRVSTSVNDPNVVEQTPEDNPRGEPIDWCKWLFFLIVTIILLWLLWYLVRKKSK